MTVGNQTPPAGPASASDGSSADPPFAAPAANGRATGPPPAPAHIPVPPTDGGPVWAGPQRAPAAGLSDRTPAPLFTPLLAVGPHQAAPTLPPPSTAVPAGPPTDPPSPTTPPTTPRGATGTIPPGATGVVPTSAPPPPGPGRLRRAPVVVLLVAVLLAGLAYAGYRQFTGGAPEGWRWVAAPGYEVAVPPMWTDAAPGTPPVTVFGVPFVPSAQAAGYSCANGAVARGVVASALIAVPSGVGLDQAATAFARGAGEALYPSATPQVAVGPAAERRLGVVTASRVEATVRTDGAGGCRATDASVQVLVVPRMTAADGAIGAAVLVVAGDLRGGPAQPAPVTRDELVRLLDSAVLP